MTKPPRTVLVILDGFGFNPNEYGNAIYAAKTPNLDYLWSNFPRTLIKAAEEEVGLNFGQIGNSEVGHLAIGTGRVIQSPLQRINSAIEDKTFFQNLRFLEAMNHIKSNQSRLHLVGMTSSAGVHAELKHMFSLLELAKSQGVTQVYIHPILDGRDTGPREALIHLGFLMDEIKKLGIGKIATIGGRSFAMDRNNNWKQSERYYDALTGQAVPHARDAISAINNYYSQNLDDETIPPTIVDSEGTIKDGDAMILVNFREDRMRQLGHVLIDQSFTSFPRNHYPKNFLVVTMTEYEKSLTDKVAFPALDIQNTLSDVLEQAELRQLHISETEKYAHVTYFFNGGREQKLPHEDYVNVPSDPPERFLENPAMQADKIAEYVVSDFRKGNHDMIIVNFANPDMIGHTGHWEKTIIAVEAVDRAVGYIAHEVLAENGVLFITADHGNAELKIDLITRKNSKDHTINPVPFMIVSNHLKKAGNSTRVTYDAQITGILQDVAPTILKYLGLPVPKEMTGTPLF